VDALSRLIIRPIRLSALAASGSSNRRSSTSSNSGIPNPFKVLKSLSEEPTHVVEDDREKGRVEVGEKNELGTLSFQASVSGTRIFVATDGQAARIAIWSNEELSVLSNLPSHMLMSDERNRYWNGARLH
jgi:hypothetical protein